MGLTVYPHGVKTDVDGVTAVTFASASTAQTVYAYVPVKCELVAVTYVGETAARVAAHTLKIGSAGTTLVSAVSNTTGVAGVTEDLTITEGTLAAGDSISCTRAAQGSTGTSKLNIVYKRID